MRALILLIRSDGRAGSTTHGLAHLHCTVFAPRHIILMAALPGSPAFCFAAWCNRPCCCCSPLSLKCFTCCSKGQPAIGFLHFTSFAESTAREVTQALQHLQRQGAQAFVMDLRDNAVGHIHSTIWADAPHAWPGMSVLSVAWPLCSDYRCALAQCRHADQPLDLPGKSHITVSTAQGGLVSAGTGIAELLLSEGRVFGHVHDQHSMGDPLRVGPAEGAKMTTQPLVRLSATCQACCHCLRKVLGLLCSVQSDRA